MKIELEQVVNGTPEFQALSAEKQMEQLQLLLTGLSGLSASAKLGASQREIAIRAGELLERALTGKFEAVMQIIDPPKKSRAHRAHRK